MCDEDKEMETVLRRGEPGERGEVALSARSFTCGGMVRGSLEWGGLDGMVLGISNGTWYQW